MSEIRRNFEKGYLYLGAIIALAVIVSSFIFISGLKEMTFRQNTISVKGYAQKNVVSDLVVWQPKIQAWSANLSEAYAKLKVDTDKFINFLTSKGISKDNIKLKSVENTVTYEKQGYEDNLSRKTGYLLVQGFYIESKEVDKVTQLSQEAAEILSAGVEMIAESPDYYLTNIENEKIALLGLAIENAKARAEEIAKKTQSKITGLKSASQGVFQVTEKNSMEVSDYGLFDTKSLEKTIKCVVSAEFFKK